MGSEIGLPASTQRVRLSLALLDATVFVSDVDGSDVNGKGSLMRPYKTMQHGHDQANPWDTVFVLPGDYDEGGLILTKPLRWLAFSGPGSARVVSNLPGGMSVVVRGAVTGQWWEGIDAVNTDITNPASEAMVVDNALATLSGDYIFRNARFTVGAGAQGNGIRVTGANGAPIRVDVQSPAVIGDINVTVGDNDDIVVFRNTIFDIGSATWGTFQGTGGGIIAFINSHHLGLGGTETIDFGAGAAAGFRLAFGSSALAVALNMNNLAGAGFAYFMGSSVSRIYASQENQFVHYINGDHRTIYKLRVNVNNAPAVLGMYTPPAGMYFFPVRSETTNRDAVTAGGLNYQYNGSGPGTVVPAVGIGALPRGTAREAVSNPSDAIAGVAQSLEFEILAVTGAGAAEYVDTMAEGRLV